MKFSIWIGALLLLFSIDASAQIEQDVIRYGKVLPEEIPTLDGHRAAACAPSSALRDLEWNNVRTLIETGGNMWHNRAQFRSAYEVPKGGGVSAIFAGALWMGGLSPDQQLKLAAVRLRTSGNDFWPGPLTNDGTAEVDESTCVAWDRFYLSEKSDAERHRAYWDCVNDPSCDLSDEFPNGYSMPQYFNEYPAQGNVSLGQDFYLAPFLDYDGDGFYSPTQGDYPWYDFLQEINCFERRREDPVPLFGDQTLYWIFNDKGNIHSESQGEPIGMEIRAQAFAFATNDEVNNMTFYNYTLINQGTQTLTNTYFGSWVDNDIGGHTDDYVGCDVQRGLGYAYNGDAFDDPTGLSFGYGENPPALGVDFFEGPFQDSDNKDNPLTDDINEAVDEGGIPYRGLGIGYGDGIIDNERFGMRRFVYFNYSSANNGLPTTAIDYYNYMRGIWKNGQDMAYGGDGLNPTTGADLSIPAEYMFPGDSDPYNWGTKGQPSPDWTEQTATNPPGDRNFLQSAGPFTLQPGDYNNITLGVVWARATSGDAFESVELVRIADDKAQALFDNCFEIVSGPDAPDISIQELDRELILYLTNENPLSNNYKEEYFTFDPSIPETAPDGSELDSLSRTYFFQGYQIYQLASSTVSVAELEDPDMARLIFQCDVQDEVTQLINYDFDPDMSLPVAQLMADGANEGVQHSFRVSTDAFATGDNALVNHRTYYFMALAYGYNNYAPYDPVLGNGQDEQYKASRKGALGAIRTYSGIPHIVNPEDNGTLVYANYGDGVELTKIEGRGNGTSVLELAPETKAEILANGYAPEVTYQAGAGPVDVKIVDPTRLPAADFQLRLVQDTVGTEGDLDVLLDTLHWELTNLTMLSDEDPFNDDDAVYTSAKTIQVGNEDLLLDWGLSITWNQYQFLDDDGEEVEHFTEFLSGTIDYDDPTQPWLLGINDQEGFTELNWIRAGNSNSEELAEEIIFDDSEAGSFWDENEVYEGVLDGTWSPYCLVSHSGNVTLGDGSQVTLVNVAPTFDGVEGDLSAPPNQYRSNIQGLNNVDIHFTSDKDLWTRCAVLEMQSIEELTNTGDAIKTKLRQSKSVDKNGRNVDQGGNSNEATSNGSQPTGMGWFPGYAIDVETGERLNMAFGEDSFLEADNGRDMIWNPSERVQSFIGGQTYGGGQHWIYVFKNMRHEVGQDNRMPAYDAGAYLYNNLEADFSTSNRFRVFRACTWVGSALASFDYPMLSAEDGLVPNDCVIKLRVAKPYEKYSVTVSDVENPDQIQNAQNLWNPLYTFSTRNLAAETGITSALQDGLDDINVVPNPYYAFSQYETNKLDNRVKVTNLPQECTVTIYNVGGTMVRQYKKGDPLTSLDWDLKNHRNIPVASGVYIIHVDVPGVGEKVLKWFGVMRPVDLDNF